MNPQLEENEENHFPHFPQVEGSFNKRITKTWKEFPQFFNSSNEENILQNSFQAHMNFNETLT